MHLTAAGGHLSSASGLLVLLFVIKRTKRSVVLLGARHVAPSPGPLRGNSCSILLSSGERACSMSLSRFLSVTWCSRINVFFKATVLHLIRFLTFSGKYIRPHEDAALLQFFLSFFFTLHFIPYSKAALQKKKTFTSLISDLFHKASP